ncbi:MAG: acyl CoA:acetate/3-ketoacid CoA transferase, partial [Deltaproteobacteria bacterium]|nr:acyl CoA:acetate/3-ketoacid CoA transferase [Deltaproteobacteria bacterium]
KKRLLGIGGFLNVAISSKKRVHCGAFTGGEFEAKIEEERLTIIKEGEEKKFVDEVDQITVSGEYALEVGQPVMVITERGVFEWTKEGLILKEIAPGIDIKKDIIEKMAFQPIIAKDLKKMTPELFRKEPLNKRF